MKIIEKIQEIMDDNDSKPEGKLEITNLAVAALQGGIQSMAWEEYMIRFTDNNNADQLARLKGTDGTLNDPQMSLRRAYLVANAICTPGSTDHLNVNVETIDL